MDVMEAYTDIIKENIEYEYLLRDNPYKKGCNRRDSESDSGNCECEEKDGTYRRG